MLTDVLEQEKAPLPGAETHQAHELLGETVNELAARFDLDAYDHYLARMLDGQEQRITPVNLAEFERPLTFPGFPEGFRPHLYKQHADDTQGGLRPTRTERLGGFGDVPVFDKREDTHEYVRAFKVRGALFAMLATLAEQPEVRVFRTASTGNHARGIVAGVNMLNAALIESGAVRVNDDGEIVADDAHKLFVAEIYAGRNLDPGKRQALVDGGASVKDYFDSLEHATRRAERDARDDDLAAFIHPFTGSTATGQGTLGLELLLDLAQQGVDLRREPVTLRIAVGGGGMYRAQAAVFERAKAKGLLHPASCVVGVEELGNDSGNRKARGLEPLTTRTLGGLAGGIATLESDDQNVAVLKALSPGGVRVVNDDYILLATEKLAEAHGGAPPEFAGVLSLASLLQYGHSGSGVEVTVSCGGNGSPTQLHELLEKKSLHEDERVAVAASRLARAVFAMISRDTLEARPQPVVVSGERYRAPRVFRVLSGTFPRW
jgi:threonine dehydratase